MLRGRLGAESQPAVIARPITWDAALVGHHLVRLNPAFATMQLLWPADRARTTSPTTRAPFTAARAVGAPAARALWLVFWLGALLRGAASLTAQQGLAPSIAFGVAFAVIAVGVYLPAPALRAVLALALVVSVAIWVFAQALGAVIASGATDPNSAPLLALLALAYWPAGMLTTALTTLPGTAWEVIFGLLAAWFAVRVPHHHGRRDGVPADIQISAISRIMNFSSRARYFR